ncbi:hypothetical protein DFH06DRAFT_1292737 [Mycena polygramma]|nr:hypothetical protein DFH06DRAFT_1292737 [Mycena polygramma]
MTAATAPAAAALSVRRTPPSPPSMRTAVPVPAAAVSLPEWQFNQQRHNQLATRPGIAGPISGGTSLLSYLHHKDLIFSSYCPGGLDRDEKVLARLGRTCKTIHDSAMDVLWRDLADFTRILRCIPPGVLKLSGRSKDSKRNFAKKRMQILCRPIVPRDWDRFLVYAQRVKKFSFTSRWDMSFSEILPALSQSLPVDCFFPNLVELEWFPFQKEYCPYFRLFMSSNITSLSTSFDSLNMPLSYSPALFSTVSLRCRPLHKVRVDYSAEDIDDHSRITLSTFIHQLSVVEDLNVPLPNYSSLEHVSRLKTLRRIHIPSLPADTPLCISPRSATLPPSFVNLTELTLENSDFKAAATVISMCTESAFERLTFFFRKGVTDEVAGQFYNALARCGRSHASLRFLKLCADWDPPFRRANFPVRSQRIQTLFCFRNLTDIELESSYGFELNDSVCAQMACAWPQAERLTLREFYPPRHQSAVTPECLLSFARHCPALTRLQLTFDARSIPQLPRPEQLISQTTLEHLYVGYSPVDLFEPNPAATFIGAIFPQLKFITTGGEDAYKHREVDPDMEADDEFFAWRAVADVLPGYREMCNSRVWK